MQKIPTLLSIAIAVLALAPACQAVFGDFKVDLSALDDRVCEVDQYRCSGERLEVCAQSRNHWELAETCVSPGQCNLNADTCRPCEAGVERQCDGATLFTCDADGQWQKLKDCPTAALCSATAGDCLPPACARRAFRCLDDGTLEGCRDDQTGWQKVAVCASPADCNAASAKEQADAGLLITCTPTCARGTGACSTPTCDRPGALRCQRNNSSLKRCSETYQWRFLSQCKNFQLCNVDLGRCEEPRCAEDERRCNGNTVERCKPDLTGWDPVRACPSGTLCDPSAPEDSECVPGGCTAGETRCNSLFIESCSDDGWVRTRRCEKTCNPATKECTE